MLTLEEMRKDLEARGHRIVENTMSDGELEKLEEELEKEDSVSGALVFDDGPWEMTVARIRAMRESKRRENASKPVTMRIPVRVIEFYKKKAALEGVGYQTLMNEVLEAALA